MPEHLLSSGSGKVQNKVFSLKWFPVYYGKWIVNKQMCNITLHSSKDTRKKNEQDKRVWGGEHHSFKGEEEQSS